MTPEDKRVMQKYAYQEVAPVMVEYTKWILNECKIRGLKKVYFLARDGYLLYKLANEICEKNNLNIDCRYLYCSRFSLRMPSYHIIGDEAQKLLFSKGYYYTTKSVLERADLNENEIKKVLKEIKVLDSDKNLTEKEFEELVLKLKNNKTFNDLLEKKSKEAYKNTIQYFKEQGLFDDENIVIADVGWIGSMQRSLRQLVKEYGYNGNIIGFYFGLFTTPKQEDGEYLTYYFSAKNGTKRKVMFNNNLFECMLSANHGMTMGYEKTSDGTKPMLKPFDSNLLDFVNLQIDTVVSFAKENKDVLSVENFNLKKSINIAYKHLKRVMIYPTKDEVEMLSNFIFCDDVTEGYHLSLADKNMSKSLKASMIFPRVFRKVFKKKNTEKTNLFWPYGVVVYQPKILRPWYRLNLKIWDTLRYIIKK